MPEQLRKLLKISGFVLLALIILLALIKVFSPNNGIRLANEGAVSSGSFDRYQASSPKGEMMALPAERDLAYDLSPDSSAGQAIGNAIAESVDKKIIKTGSLNLTVEKAETASEAIANLAKLYQGEVANSSFSQSSRGIKSGYITIRVPFQNFDKVFNEIKKVATQVLSESTNAQDITEEYIDLEARLKNKKAEEQSFVALLSRSGKIEEVLAVTREIARVRGEIEQLEGRLRYLNSQTDMSTLTINLSEDVEITSASQDWRPWQVVKTAVQQLITSGQNFVDWLIRFVIVVLPVLIIYSLVIWLLYYLGKRAYRRFKKPQ